MTIRFFCVCGQPLAAPDQFSGQTVRCMACQEPQVVPHATSQGLTSPGLNADDDGLDRQQPRSQRGGWRNRLGVLASVVLLLAGVAGLWWLFFRGDSVSAEFDLVPRDALAFVTIEVPKVLITSGGERAVRRARGALESELLAWEKNLGLKLEDLERLTAVTYDFGLTSWVILHTTRDVDPVQLVHNSAFNLESLHRGRAYHSDADGRGLIFVNSRTLVVGPERGIQRCLELPRWPTSGPLIDTIRLASKKEHHAVAGVNGSRLAAWLKIEEAANVVPSLSLVNDGIVTATGMADDKVDLDVRIDLPTDEKARKVVEAVPVLKPWALGIWAVRQLTFDNPLMGDVISRLATLTLKYLDQLEPKQEGTRVRFRVKLEPDDLLAVMGVEEKERQK